MSSDPHAGRYHTKFAAEFRAVQRALAGRGGEQRWSAHDWQAFTYKEPGVSLIFYPHRGPSSGLQCLRVRNQNSKSPDKLAEVARLVAERAGIRMRIAPMASS